ncbi:MAG: tetratricopeptide repeat protein [Blastocatellia bacterium]|nr:tetratricopeptide repeat protein [Blastocatellia bacterium]
MRRKFFIIVIPGIIIGVVLALMVMAFSSENKVPEADFLEPVVSKDATAADKQIASAQAVIKKIASDERGYNLLASAFMQKARETGDFSLNARAEESLKYSFRVSPDNYESLKLQAVLKLVYHQFAEGLEIAKRAQKINPRDHEIYGTLVDANVELGDYQSAVDAAQKMVDLKPNIASYSRISYLRSLHGDTKGAIAAMQMAISAGNLQNPESIAWCRVHLGDELINVGKHEEAEREYDHALFLLPDYHLALAAKARARTAAGDTENAVAFYKRAIERLPAPDYVAALGDIYIKSGRTEEAKQQYEQVEFIEKLGETGGTYSRQLALFWADHDVKLDEALAAAQSEYASRKDIYAADLLAWTLYKKANLPKQNPR